MRKIWISKYVFPISCIVLGTLIQYSFWKSSLPPGEKINATTFDYLAVSIFIATYLIAVLANITRSINKFRHNRTLSLFKTFQYVVVVKLEDFGSYYLSISCMYLVFHICATTNWEYLGLWMILTPIISYTFTALSFYAISEGLSSFNERRKENEKNE